MTLVSVTVYDVDASVARDDTVGLDRACAERFRLPRPEPLLGRRRAGCRKPPRHDQSIVA
jgi:hypothetical protein